MINHEDLEIYSYTSTPGTKVHIRAVHKPTGTTAVVEHPFSYYKARQQAIKELYDKLQPHREESRG